jgi:hypothetical protein
MKWSGRILFYCALPALGIAANILFAVGFMPAQKDSSGKPARTPMYKKSCSRTLLNIYWV